MNKSKKEKLYVDFLTMYYLRLEKDHTKMINIKDLKYVKCVEQEGNLDWPGGYYLHFENIEDLTAFKLTYLL